MKTSFLLVAFCFFVPLFAVGEESLNDFLSPEPVPEQVDCSNIMQVIESYLDLNGKNHFLMGISLNKLSALMSGEPGFDNPEQLREEVEDASFFMSTNQEILFNMEHTIRKVLPDCLQ